MCPAARCGTLSLHDPAATVVVDNAVVQISPPRVQCGTPECQEEETPSEG